MLSRLRLRRVPPLVHLAHWRCAKAFYLKDLHHTAPEHAAAGVLLLCSHQGGGPDAISAKQPCMFLTNWALFSGVQTRELFIITP